MVLANIVHYYITNTNSVKVINSLHISSVQLREAQTRSTTYKEHSRKESKYDNSTTPPRPFLQLSPTQPNTWKYKKKHGISSAQDSTKSATGSLKTCVYG